MELILDEIKLTVGQHDTREQGVCIMELSAWLAGEPHSDHPACVSPVLGAFLRNWNDSVDDAFRERLKPYATRVLNTAGDGRDEERAWLCTDWLVRVCAPAWLDLAKLTQHAMALRTADQIRDSPSATLAQPQITAAGAAAGDAAWTAAGDAAWTAARDAAWAAAGAAARAAAWTAAGDAAWTAARDAAWAAAGAAAGAAARAALQPTIAALQEAAILLLESML